MTIGEGQWPDSDPNEAANNTYQSAGANHEPNAVTLQALFELARAQAAGTGVVTRYSFQNNGEPIDVQTGSRTLRTDPSVTALIISYLSPHGTVPHGDSYEDRWRSMTINIQPSVGQDEAGLSPHARYSLTRDENGELHIKRMSSLRPFWAAFLGCDIPGDEPVEAQDDPPVPQGEAITLLAFLCRLDAVATDDYDDSLRLEIGRRLSSEAVRYQTEALRLYEPPDGSPSERLPTSVYWEANVSADLHALGRAVYEYDSGRRAHFPDDYTIEQVDMEHACRTVLAAYQSQWLEARAAERLQ